MSEHDETTTTTEGPKLSLPPAILDDLTVSDAERIVAALEWAEAEPALQGLLTTERRVQVVRQVMDDYAGRLRVTIDARGKANVEIGRAWHSLGEGLTEDSASAVQLYTAGRALRSMAEQLLLQAAVTGRDQDDDEWSDD